MKLYLQNRSNLLNEVESKSEITTNLLQADALITWNSVLPEQVRNLELAREYKVPSFVINHGYFGENDHNPDIIDNITNQNGKPMIADKYLSFGQQGKDILLRSGVADDKVGVVGCPICWEHKYLYVCKEAEQVVVMEDYSGQEIFDPKTKEKWILDAEDHYPIKHLGGKRIAFFPNHSGHMKERTKEVYEQLKGFENLCICASSNWLTMKEDNPFEELIADKSPDRMKRILFPNIQSPINHKMVKELITRSAAIVCVVPATAALIAYTCGVPVVMPDYDWQIRNKAGERVDNFTKADTICPANKLKDTIEDILNNGISEQLRQNIQSEAIYSAGIELGNPTDNILSQIKERV